MTGQKDSKWQIAISDCFLEPCTAEKFWRLIIAPANGVLAVVGMLAEPKVSWTSLWFKELKVVGTYTYGFEVWQDKKVRTIDLALSLLKETLPLLKGFVTHKLPLFQCQQAIQTAIHTGRNKAVKVAMHP